MSAYQAFAACLRAGRGRLLAALTLRIGDLGRAEDALQEAAASALIRWGRAGVPQSPGGWLMRVALRKESDRLRRAGRQSRNAAAMAALAQAEVDETDPEAIPDARLRLIFTCCHPPLEAKTRVALMECGALTVAGQEIEALAADLAPYQPFHAARAEWLARAGRREEAVLAFGQALIGATPAEAGFLRARGAELSQ